MDKITPEPMVLLAAAGDGTRWRLGTRLLFRFSALYFTLYILSTYMTVWLLALPLPLARHPGSLPPLRQLVTWVASHVFGAAQPLVMDGGSADRPFDWALAFCVLALSVLGTGMWSLFDYRRPNYRTAHAWFHLLVRFALGSTLTFYGMSKIIPLQMPAPTLTQLLEPFGHFSPASVLWTSVGSSPGYQAFLGAFELVAAMLLFLPRLATLGALLALTATIQILALNLAYDIPVKVFSFHLVLMAVVLLAPERNRLVDVLVLNRASRPSWLAPLARDGRRARFLVTAQLLFGAYIVVMNVHNALQLWRTFGGGVPRPPLYGIWTVDTMSIAGVVRGPLLTDAERWRRVIFDAPGTLSYQRMDDTFHHERVAVDTGTRTISSATAWATPVALSYDQPTPQQLVLDGQIGERHLRLEMTLVDPSTFTLLSRGFHWVQDYPFYR